MEYKQRQQQTLILRDGDIDTLGLIINSFYDRDILNGDESLDVHDFIDRFIEVVDDGN